jgi:hypothetical protein
MDQKENSLRTDCQVSAFKLLSPASLNNTTFENDEGSIIQVLPSRLLGIELNGVHGGTAELSHTWGRYL